MQYLEVCPVCEGTEQKLIYPSTLNVAISSANIPNPYSAHYQINQCINCDLRFSSPILDNEGINTLYTQSGEGNIVAGEEDNVKYTMANYYKLVMPYLKNKKRVLDIGCDVGFFLESASKDGFSELHGLEPTKPAREVAEQLPCSFISEKFYEEISYQQNYFDLISMIHVLDHLVDPSIALSKAYNELSDGGIIFAVVHNSKSMLGTIMGEKFPVYNLYHHYFFTKKTLRNLCVAHKFDVIKVISTYNCYSFEFFVRKIPFLPVSIKNTCIKVMKLLKINKLKINIPIGNIGIIATKLTKNS